jgi:tRNA pseudouridine55 synthase
MTGASRNARQRHGVLVLDKPKGPTSTACLEKIKRVLGQKKIGHAGTLDPMATGVLVVLLGEGTKLAPYLEQGTKVYRGRILLGRSTDTFDIEGVTEEERPWDHIRPGDVQSVIESWTTITQQEVPAYSAAKHRGRPLYSIKRQGGEVPRKTKPVRIDRAEVLDIRLPEVAFRVTCSHGTYIRSLAHSLGIRLGCGAVLSDLVREQSYPFSLRQACSLDSVLGEPESFPERIIPLQDSLPHWRQIRLGPELVRRVRNGHWIRPEETEGYSPPREDGEKAFLLSSEEAPVALAEARTSDGARSWAILRGFVSERAVPSLRRSGNTAPENQKTAKRR